MNNKYRLLINGTNFPSDKDGSEQKCGFYFTRYIEAENEELAETTVIQALNIDTRLVNLVRNKSNDSPLLSTDEIEKVEEIDSPDESGLAWYTEKTGH